MSYVRAIKRAIKEEKGEKLSIFEKIDEWWDNLWIYTWGFRHVRDFKYYMKHLLWNRYDLIRTKLPKSQYHDSPVLILYGMMNLVVEHVEVEKCFEHTDFESSPDWQEVGKTIKEVYDWWLDYPNREKEIEIALDNWHSVTYEEGKSLIDQLNNPKNSDESERYLSINDYLKKKLSDEETEMLIKVVKIRDYMWT